MAAAQGTFMAKLSGKEVVPAVETKAMGEANFTLSKDGKDYITQIKKTGTA